MERCVVLLVLLCVGVGSVFVDSKSRVQELKPSRRGLDPHDKAFQNEVKRNGDGLTGRGAGAEDEVGKTSRPYRGASHWTTPTPHSGVDLGFTPIQTYLSVRRTNQVKHLPRSEAYKESTSPDELLNAHRLREVVRTKKIQEVYSEEGYEDLGYDHGSHQRFAEYEEDFNKPAKTKKRGSKLVDETDSNHSESQVHAKKAWDGPKVSRKKVELKKVQFSYDGGSDEKLQGKNSANLKQNKSDKNHQTFSGFPPGKADFWDFSSQIGDWNKPKSRETVPSKENAKNSKSPRSSKSEKKQNDTKVKSESQELPNFRFIHSLTDAHYGQQASLSKLTNSGLPKPITSKVIGMTDGLDVAPDLSSFEPKRVSKRVKRENSDETSDYEKQLSKTLDQHERDILSAALRNVELPEKNHFSELRQPKILKTEMVPIRVGFDNLKYPYYYSKTIDPYSPLKYASDRQRFPKKSGFGMEYYDSLDLIIHCDDIAVSLDDVQSANSTGVTGPLSVQPAHKKRIIGLGEKIRCMKVKYFGEDPLDSPFFKEDSLRKISEGTVSPQVESNESSSANGSDSRPEGSQQEVRYQVSHTAPLPTAAPVKTHGIKTPDTESNLRVIPVREFLPDITTPAPIPIRGMTPPLQGHPFIPYSVITIPRIAKSSKKARKIKYKYNCLQPVSRYTVSERSDSDVTYDCMDVTLIQTVRDGNKHFKIIPKQIKRHDTPDDSDLLRAGEVVEANFHKRAKRSEDVNARRKSQLFPNRSLLDKVIKRPSIIRKNGTNTTVGSSSTEVPVATVGKPASRVGGSSTSRPVMTPTIRSHPINRAATTPRPRPTRPTTGSQQRATTASTNTNKLPKKPTKLLSGIDFLTRYQKAKNSKSAGMSADDFFRSGSPATSPRPVEEEGDLDDAGSQKNEWLVTDVVAPVVAGALRAPEGSFMRRSDVVERSARRAWDPEVQRPTPPVLMYIVNTQTGIGKWISKSSGGNSQFNKLPPTQFY